MAKQVVMFGNIDSDLVKVNVTALTFLGNRLFAGIGGDLCVFDVNLWKIVYRKNVLGSRTIHGICSNSDVSFIVVYGGRSIGIIESTCEELCVKYNLSSVFVVEDWIWWVEWMNDNATLAVIDAHNVLSQWNWSSGVKVDGIKCEEKCILYSARLVGKEWSDLVVLTGTVFQEIVIWSTDEVVKSTKDKPVLHRLHGHKGVIFSINYNSDLRKLCSTSDDRSVRVWNVESTVIGHLTSKDWKNVSIQLLFSVFGHIARVFRSCLLSDDRIISVGEDSQLCIWNREGKCISQRQCHQGGVIWSIDCNEDSGVIATGGSDGGVSIWCLETSPVVPVECSSTEDEPPRLVMLSKQRIVLTTDCGSVKVYHNNEWLTIIRDTHLANYCLLETSPNRCLLSLATIDGHVVILKEVEENSVCPLEIITYEHVITGRIFSLIWLDEEQFLLSGPNGKLYIVFLLLSRSEGKLKVGPKFILPPCKERWVTTAVLVDGMLLCGDRDGSIYLYNLNGNCISSLKYIHGRNGVTCLRYLNNRIWSTGRDGTLRQYALCNNNDDTRNTELCELVADKLAMHWVANIVSSSDDILVVGFHDKSCVVWSAKERNIMVSLPCGGGHRSWDVVLDSEFLHFAFLKNKLANVFSCPVQRICSASLLEGFHPDEINCMKKLSLQDGMWIVSGGEDNTVRISQYKCNKWKTKSVVRSHLSSVRAIATVSLPCGSYVFTAGGRAQIKVWKVVQHFEEDALLIEVASHMLKEEKRTGPWRHVVPINDPEPRYMDIIVSVESEDNIQVLAVAADSRLRLFKFDASQNRIQLCKESLYSNRCLLKVFTVKCSDNCKIVCTVATDGKVAWWDIDKVEENYKPFSVLSLHQSGINSCDWVALSSNKFLLVTGGDDSSLACTVLNFATGPKLNVMKETEQIFRSEHTSNISGIKIWKDLIISSGTDQRVCIFKWCTTSGLDVTLASQCSSVVADVQGIEVWQQSEDCLTVCVYGIGFEVFSTKYNASGHLSVTL